MNTDSNVTQVSVCARRFQLGHMGEKRHSFHYACYQCKLSKIFSIQVINRTKIGVCRLWITQQIVAMIAIFSNHNLHRKFFNQLDMFPENDNLIDCIEHQMKLCMPWRASDDRKHVFLADSAKRRPDPPNLCTLLQLVKKLQHSVDGGGYCFLYALIFLNNNESDEDYACWNFVSSIII